MEIESRIIFTYGNNEEANIALGSLKPDNMDFVKAHVKDNCLICDLQSGSLRTLLATIDDLLFCEIMAGKIIDFTNNEN